MYNEGRNNFVRDSVVKILLVLLFVFLLIWLFPMPNLNPFYDRIFADNIKSMKEVARSYYTVERLPKNIGDKEKITLKEMLDKKMIIPFVDKDGNSCDPINSYVEVVKMDTEYLFKTNLSCSTKTDYVVDYFGCYDICKDNSCLDKDKYATECELTRTIDTKTLDRYVCPVGYILNGKVCTKTLDNTDTKPATISCKSGYTYNETSNKCEKTITSEVDATPVCPSGFVYNQTTKKCLKTTGESIDADPSCVAFPGYAYNSVTKKCEKPITTQVDATPTCTTGYSYNATSNKCEKVITSETDANPVCATGYTFNTANKQCEKTISNEIDANPVCATGYTYNTTKKICEKTVTSEVNANPICATGYTFNINSKQCEKEISTSTAMCATGYTYNATKKICEKPGTLIGTTKQVGTGTYTNWVCDDERYTTMKTEVITATFKRTYEGMSFEYNGCSSSCPIVYYNFYECSRSEIMKTVCADSTYTMVNGVCKKSVTYTDAAKTTCSGGTISGSTCITKSIDSKPPTYTCSTGTPKAGDASKCIVTTIDPKPPTYTCSAGTPKTGDPTKCVVTTIDPKPPTYTCSAGTPKTGDPTKCIVTTTDQKTPSYVCPSGYTQDGTKCNKSTIDQKTPTYSCPAGYTKNGTKCERTTNEEANPTYRCPTGVLNGLKCIITTVDKIDSYYGCPVSYILDGKTCYKTSKQDENKDAEAIYKTTKKTEYTWNRNCTLSGWQATGKTRQVKIS